LVRHHDGTHLPLGRRNAERQRRAERGPDG
jgi:hypothetical protein